MAKHQLTLWPSGKILEVDDKKPLLEQIKASGQDIKSGCGGTGSCADCVVKILTGDEFLSEPTQAESRLLGNVYHITKERLSCQLHIHGPVKIDLTEQEKALNKAPKRKVFNKANLKKRSEQEAKDIVEERRKKSAEKREAKTNTHKHWENKNPEAKKIRGGGKRPKAFKNSSSDSES